VWLVVVQQESDYRKNLRSAVDQGASLAGLTENLPFAYAVSRIVCAVRTKATAERRAAAHRAANADDATQTFITGFRVETGTAPAVFVATVVIQVGHMIKAVSEVKATAVAKKRASFLEAVSYGAGDEFECVVKRYEVDAE
jgi:hypothetical protein